MLVKEVHIFLLQAFLPGGQKYVEENMDIMDRMFVYACDAICGSSGRRIGHYQK